MYSVSLKIFILNFKLILIKSGTSLAVQWLRLRLSLQGVRVQSLVGELRSHMPQAKKIKHKTEAIL